jgi:hypothetical protein
LFASVAYQPSDYLNGGWSRLHRRDFNEAKSADPNPLAIQHTSDLYCSLQRRGQNIGGARQVRRVGGHAACPPQRWRRGGGGGRPRLRGGHCVPPPSRRVRLSARLPLCSSGSVGTLVGWVPSGVLIGPLAEFVFLRTVFLFARAKGFYFPNYVR